MPRAALHCGRFTRRGFTMVEMMITLIIVAILASVGVAMYDHLVSPALGNEVESALSALRKAQRAYKSTKGSYATSKEQLVQGGYMQEGDFSDLHYVSYESLRVTDPTAQSEEVVAIWDGTKGGGGIDRFEYVKVKLTIKGEWIKIKEADGEQ